MYEIDQGSLETFIVFTEILGIRFSFVDLMGPTLGTWHVQRDEMNVIIMNINNGF